MALVKTEGRSCFGLEWYDNEAEAIARGKEVRERGDKVNGGFMDGAACDRAPEHDVQGQLYAVRVR